jgi:ribonucleoside-triphosphate reductase
MRIETTFSNEFDEWYNKIMKANLGPEFLDIEGISRRCIDVGLMSHSYFTKNFTDETIDSNANTGESISPNNYGSEIVKGVQKLEGFYLLHRYASRRYGLEKANRLLNAIVRGDLYFHDSSGPGIQEVYCTSVSTYPIMTEGRKYGPLHSLPPKRADSFIAQCIEFTMDLSQQFAGAVALGDLFINYAYYSRKENLSDKIILNDFQKFVHVVNNTFRVSEQSPFSNLSIFDIPNLEKVFGDYKYPDGSSPDFEYIMNIQKLFCEWFSHGDPKSGFPYRFPIITMNLLCDKDKNILDTDFLDFISKVNLEKACFNIYINSGEKIASCCRMINDKKRMQFKVDTFGNGGMNVGSVRVVTINPVRIAIKSNGDQTIFFQKLQQQLENARDLLIVHREDIIKRRIDAGFLKFFKPLNWLNLKRYFSTFGIVGIYEMNKTMGYDITSEDGIKFTAEVLKYIEDFAIKSSNELGFSFNVEEIPAESAASKLAQKDRLLFGKNKIPFELYSNQYVPLIEQASIPERIITTGKFMEILSGGGILHLNIAEQIKDPEVMKHLIEYSVKHGVSHLAVNYGFGQCKNRHTTICGNNPKCSICGSKIDTYVTRIVGYQARVSNFSKVRREYEFPRRVFN